VFVSRKPEGRTDPEQKKGEAPVRWGQGGPELGPFPGRDRIVEGGPALSAAEVLADHHLGQTIHLLRSGPRYRPHHSQPALS
jgi:hypothetical protein